jgi:hypothetical protein
LEAAAVVGGAAVGAVAGVAIGGIGVLIADAINENNP